MKVCWNILICMWIGVIHGAVHANGTFELTSSSLTATDGELFTMTCIIRGESAANIGWLQNNKSMVVTQQTPNCNKQALAYGGDIINRINVSCNTTAHSMTFRFNSTADQGAAWQCGKQVSDNDIHPRSNIDTIGTDGHGHTSSHVMSTKSLSATTQHMETASDPLTLTTKNGTDEQDHSASPVISTQSSSTITRNTEMTSDQETVTTKDGTDEHDHTASSAMSTQSLSTTTRNTEMTSDQETVTTKDAFAGEHLYIVVGAVGGAVLLTVVVVGVVCIRWRRRAAHQQNDMKEERINKATTVYQNTSDCNTVENDLYERSRDVQPMNAAMNQEDDFMLSDAYASVDMPLTNTCTPTEEVPFGDVNLENLSPVYQNTTGKITVGNDLYEGSRDVQPMNAAMNQEDDFMLSDAYAGVDMPVTKTCTPREEVPSGDVNLENLSPVYQNTTGSNTVGNDLYEGSCDVQPMNAAENQEDDFMLSDAYASVDMPVTNTCTPREEVPFGDVNLENLYAKPDRSRHTEVQHVSDIYAVVQKP